MCGDGANDAPALRQAQMGVAVSTATDVAKSVAGIVLTEPGLGGVVAAVREGRTTFQWILTFTFRSIIRKIAQVLFLLAELVISGGAVLASIALSHLDRWARRWHSSCSASCATRRRWSSRA
jgi:H+-transporting ATPase